ncbi:ABC transporter ATP-binding protein [Demequina sp. NBRC 110052]|uniref:ABC transporter ATP-binding protein n=1 Tax=Demequina sp. NBRC 110052 TaxID=1570341 RepID=UPI000A0396BF|nr:ABC transporter ATP-binding protein [Demequina sp. NBRC 110052]
MEPSVIVDGVVKRFRIRHVRSLKEIASRAIRGKSEERNEFTALHDISFEIPPGQIVGLIGFNGSGKSTLLKCISGVLTPDEGMVGLRGRVAGLIEVGAGFHPDLTGRENVYLNGAILGMSKEEIDAAFDSIVEFSEIPEFIDTEVKFYSSGMFLRLAFSVAVHTDPDIFLVDEILAVGDEPFQRKCLARIRELHDSGKTLLIVSHDLDMIAKLCERAILLEHGRIVVDGDASEVVARLRAQ